MVFDKKRLDKTGILLDFSEEICYDPVFDSL